MAKQVLTTTILLLNAVDRSNWVSKAELAVQVEDKDVTVFSSAGWKEVIGGLRSYTLGLTLKNDMAAGALDELMYAQLGNVVTFELRTNVAARSTSNPGYTGSLMINTWSPISGSPGDVNELSLSLPGSGPLARQTS